MRIIIFGGHGFIGSAVAEKYREMGYEDVFQLSRSDNVDLMDLDGTTKVIQKLSPDIVVNCTAYVGSVHYGMGHPAEIINVNTLMTLNLYKAIEISKLNISVINPISNCTYPGQADIQIEENWWDGAPHFSALSYASARRMTYSISLAYNQQHGIDSKNFILCGIYGPGNHIDENRIHALDGLILRMIRSKRKGDKVFEVWGTGEPIREWCFIDDVAELLVLGSLLKKERVYPTNLAQEKGYSIRETVEIISEATSYDGELLFNKNYEDGAPKKILSKKKFEKLFPDFKFTDIADGVKKSVNYFEKVL